MSKHVPNKMILSGPRAGWLCSLSLIIICSGIIGLSRASSASTSHYLVREHIVLDLRSGVEWLRCSVGQVYNRGMCEGEILQLAYGISAKQLK